MKSMKSMISIGVLAASLAFGANAAVAAAQPTHTAATAAHITRAVWPDVRRARAYHGPYYGAWPYARYAAGGYAPHNLLGYDVGQFIQGMLGGGPVPYANLARDAERMHGSSGGSYAYSAPSYDNSAPVTTGNDAQLAADAENQAIQQMNDTNALTASMAAAEAQNDAANAATLQTEINAGM
jgi:hypothetical protein